MYNLIYSLWASETPFEARIQGRASHPLVEFQYPILVLLRIILLILRQKWVNLINVSVFYTNVQDDWYYVKRNIPANKPICANLHVTCTLHLPSRPLPHPYPHPTSKTQQKTNSKMIWVVAYLIAILFTVSHSFPI